MHLGEIDKRKAKKEDIPERDYGCGLLKNPTQVLGSLFSNNKIFLYFQAGSCVALDYLKNHNNKII